MVEQAVDNVHKELLFTDFAFVILITYHSNIKEGEVVMKTGRKRNGKRVVAWLLTFVMLISIFATVSTTTVMAAAADDLREGVNYIIVSKKSGKALTVEGYTDSNNAGICQMPVGNYASQVWMLDSDNNGYYQIVNKFSGKVLDVPWASTEAGAEIAQYNKGNGDNQKWKITDEGNGYCRITPKLVSGFGLNIEEASTENGAKLIQWNYAGADNELWEFRVINVGDIIAYPETDPRLAVDSFINKFTYKQNGRSVLTKSGTIWSAAETIEVMIDAYEHLGDEKYKTLFCDLIDWYIGNNGEYWSNNKYNDDVMWAVIMCSRAYLLTGQEKYLTYAKNNFDMCYDRAWSQDLGGGLWWTTDNNTKNACVNGPGAIAACLLGKATGEEAYFTKAKAIIDWESVTLLGDDGGVWDSYNTKGEYNKWVSSYNQGTFIGACTMLYEYYGEQKYFDLADKAAERSLDLNLNGEQSGGDLIGFKGILARWLGYFVETCDVEDYNDWMYRNASTVWMNRNSDNLMWTQFATVTEDNIENSEDDNKRNNAGWGCSPAVSWLVNCTGLEVVAKPVDPDDIEEVDVAGASSYEMENGVLSGGAVTVNEAGNSNGKYVGNVGGANSGATTFTVLATANGKAKLNVSYATFEARQLNIIVNDKSYVLDCPATGDWTKVGNPIAIEVDVKTGNNTIQFTGVNGKYAPNLDKFEVEFPMETYGFEVESGMLEGSTTAVNAAGASGGKYVGNVGGSGNGSATLSVANAIAGKSKLKVYYATLQARQLKVVVNGVEQVIDCAGTGGWGTVGTPVEMEVELKAGVNTIRFTGVDGAYAPNLDKFEIELTKADKEMNTLEAENNALSGGAAAVNAEGNSNGKYVGNIGGPNGGTVTFEAVSNVTEKRKIRLYYATFEARQFLVTVNGKTQTVNCTGTGDWSKVGSPVEIEVELQSGTNIIAVSGVDGAYAPNLDRIEIELTSHEMKAVTE